MFTWCWIFCVDVEMLAKLISCLAYRWFARHFTVIIEKMYWQDWGVTDYMLHVIGLQKNGHQLPYQQKYSNHIMSYDSCIQ
jgi:hypothetical protein